MRSEPAPPRPRPGAPLDEGASLRVIELAAPAPPDAARILPDVLGERLLGVLVRGALPAGPLAALRARLESGQAEVPRREPPGYGGTTFGSLRVVSADERDEPSSYFDDAACLARLGHEPFDGGAGLTERLEALLASLGPWSIGRPTDGDARPFAPFTARELPDGEAIAVHCERETMGFPGMRLLSDQIDPTSILSFYVPVQAPTGGGELVVYAARFGAPGMGSRLMELSRSDAATVAALEREPHRVIAVEVGDLLVFDAGRAYHRVTRVTGPASRWTLGGFAARSRDGTQLLVWS